MRARKTRQVADQQRLGKRALTFLTGNTFSNTKGTTVTKEKTKESRLFPPFVSFVVKLCPVNYGRPGKRSGVSS